MSAEKKSIELKGKKLPANVKTKPSPPRHPTIQPKSELLTMARKAGGYGVPGPRQHVQTNQDLVLQMYSHMKTQRRLERERKSKISRAEHRRQQLQLQNQSKSDSHDETDKNVSSSATFPSLHYASKEQQQDQGHDFPPLFHQQGHVEELPVGIAEDFTQNEKQDFPGGQMYHELPLGTSSPALDEYDQFNGGIGRGGNCYGGSGSIMNMNNINASVQPVPSGLYNVNSSSDTDLFTGSPMAHRGSCSDVSHSVYAPANTHRSYFASSQRSPNNGKTSMHTIKGPGKMQIRFSTGSNPNSTNMIPKNGSSNLGQRFRWDSMKAGTVLPSLVIIDGNSL